MKKIVSLLLFFVGAVVLINCRRKPVEPVVEQLRDVREGRSSASYKWIFLTPDLVDPAEYADSGHMRYYHLKKSAKYTRSLTLKITKWSTDSQSDPVFRIYGKEGSCLTLSNPTVSMGETTATKFYTTGSPIARTGYSWSVPLAASAVGTTATLTLTVSGTTANCTEGIILADLISPYLIASVGSYYDSDAMGFVRRSGL